MSAVFKPVFGVVKTVFSPAFYKAQYHKVVANTHREIRKDSIAPLFKMMFAVAVVMKTANYIAVGQYKHALKKDAIDKALGGHH